MEYFRKNIAKLRYWEFWPLWLTGTPLFLFCMYFGIKARRLFYLTNVNPAMKNSALLMSSKMDILNLLNPSTIPKSVFLESNQINRLELETLLKESGLSFPIIIKPDMGERGLLVEKIESMDALEFYLSKNNLSYIIQEFIDLPNEIGILFYKNPTDGEIIVSSICLKKFLAVVGDGKATLAELVTSDFHGKHQIDRIKDLYPSKFDQVIPKNETLMLEPIGNHSRGTEFIDGSHLNYEAFTDLIKMILNDHPGLNYGRFDIKYETIELLKKAQNFKVIELNGSASEPTNIYDRKYSIIEKYRIFFQHFQIMYQISCAQSLLDHKPLSFWAVLKLISSYRRYIGRIDKNVKLN